MQDLHYSEPTMDRDRLLDVVHYVCSKCDPSELGTVKLHKILYFADMLHFADTGRPLTGVQYQKQQFGPCARHLSWAIGQLSRDGRLAVSSRDFYGFRKTDYVTILKPNLDRLDNQKVLPLLDAVIDFVCSRSAKEISELSHVAPWDAVGMGETIPYYSAYWLQFPVLTEHHVKLAEERIAQLPDFA